MPLSFAERQLKKYGWEEGKGLGLQETGISEAIKVDRKHDTLGIGGQSSDQWAFEWWDHAFNKAASNIKIDSGECGNEVIVKRDRVLDRSDIVVKSRPEGRIAAVKESSIRGFVGHASVVEADDDDHRDFSTRHTDAELFNICGGRTAHKGARSTMGGKLRRAADIGMGLPDISTHQKKKKTKTKNGETKEERRARRAARKLRKQAKATT